MKTCRNRNRRTGQFTARKSKGTVQSCFTARKGTGAKSKGARARNEASELGVFMHHCGGYYAAVADSEGFHRQPRDCVIPGKGSCHDTERAALASARMQQADYENWWEYYGVLIITEEAASVPGAFARAFALEAVLGDDYFTVEPRRGRLPSGVYTGSSRRTLTTSKRLLRYIAHGRAVLKKSRR